MTLIRMLSVKGTSRALGVVMAVKAERDQIDQTSNGPIPMTMNNLET